MDRRLFMAAMLTALAIPREAQAVPRWQVLPPMPPPITGARAGWMKVNGIQLRYAEIGRGAPVVMLHGGLAHADYFGHQVPALAKSYRVILVDSRGHGRSTRDARPYSYDLMTQDVLALLDALKVARAAIVGWSDGAIIGLNMAMRHSDRIDRLFAFGANTKVSGLKPDVVKNPNFARFIERAGDEYKRLSSTPNEFDAFVAQISRMWESQPNWTDDQLRTIRSPVLIADGQYDEGIRREHTDYMAATIPGADLLILPNTSHFAFLQDPALFNAALMDFLAG